MNIDMMIPTDRENRLPRGLDIEVINITHASRICDGADTITPGTLKGINIDCNSDRIMNKINAKQ